MSIPDNITPVGDFEIDKYLGKWYEIARLDHSFERDLQNVTAEYVMRNDGGVKVINRGFNIIDNEWKTAEGKAYFVEEKNIGHLKVSFFGSFYSSYIIFESDKNYQYAFVTSSSQSYLWFLSRTPTVSDELKQQFISQVKALGFASEELIFVDQSTRR
ncbi:lipocalin family protein [Aliikangiella sp. IMCC44359]|uniref:lipocalin family protein n=1 Tax=Aliikangiella sp. IMCC44359 TaxID=3459125 RepID=UPI00403AC55F